MVDVCLDEWLTHYLGIDCFEVRFGSDENDTLALPQGPAYLTIRTTSPLHDSPVPQVEEMITLENSRPDRHAAPSTRVRQLQRDDAEQSAALMANYRNRWLDEVQLAPHRIDEAYRAWGRSLVDRCWMVEGIFDDELIGLVAVRSSEVSGVHMIDQVITHPRFRRRGIAAELLRSAFMRLPMRTRIQASVSNRNRASLRLMKALGFKERGRALVYAGVVSPRNQSL